MAHTRRPRDHDCPLHSGRVCWFLAKSQQTTIRIVGAGQLGKNAPGVGLLNFAASQDPTIRIVGLGGATRPLIAARIKRESRSHNPDRGIFKGSLKIPQTGSWDFRRPAKIPQSGSRNLSSAMQSCNPAIRIVES